jgi:hypothetical protein
MSGADQALGAALAGEYAAIYGYGVLGAQLTGAALNLARQAEAAHRDRRDSLLEMLGTDSSAPAAEPAYALPFPVTDSASAIKLAQGIEERVATLWCAALGETTGAQRKAGLAALTDAALRAARWRRAGGVSPSTVALPGSPL